MRRLLALYNWRDMSRRYKTAYHLHRQPQSLMPFLQLILNLGHADPSSVEETLFAIGAVSVTLEDAADDPILEPAPGAMPLWPTVNIKALFDVNVSQQEILNGLKTLESLPSHRFETIEDRPWERE